MLSERIQRRIDRLLDQAEEAADSEDWVRVSDLADRVMALDSGHEDASALLEMTKAGSSRAKPLAGLE